MNYILPRTRDAISGGAVYGELSDSVQSSEYGLTLY